MAVKKRGLGGRGFTALSSYGDDHQAKPAISVKSAVPASDASTVHDGQLLTLPVEWIQRSPYQPRRDIAPEALDELAASITAQGVLQPIVVRPLGERQFELIAGERRWRASQLAGQATIPAMIRLATDEMAMAMALIENVQREDLNALEQALALARLQQECGMTHQAMAEAVGKSRAGVSNLLRLLSLPEDVQRLLEYGDIEAGHAKALLGLPAAQQTEAANTVVAKALSVRQTEALVRRLLAGKGQSAFKQTVDPDVERLERRLSATLGVPVVVKHRTQGGGGQVVLKYHSLDELEGILQHIQ